MKPEKELLHMIDNPITSNEAVQQLIAIYLRDIRNHLVPQVEEATPEKQPEAMPEIATLSVELPVEEVKEEVPVEAPKKATRKKKTK